MKLKNKTAIITGAGYGIGQSIAKLFYEEGANIIATCIHDFDNLETFIKDISENKGNALALKSDASKKEDVAYMVEKAVDTFGDIDILVNNVGISDKRKKLLDIEEDEWDYIFETNIKSMFLCCKHIVPIMIKKPRSVIINIGSIASFTYQSGGIAYATTKHAVLGFTKKLAVEYGHLGIKINCICPGITKSKATSHILYDKSDRIHDLIETIPLRRYAHPDEIANVALFLASNDSDYIQGSNIVVDGGRSLIY